MAPYLLEPRDLEPRAAYVPPKSMTAGVLIVFCLLAASIGLMCLWLFVRKGGFIWKSSDWEDYKSSVLRQPSRRPDDAITVFSDGSTRRGGGSTMGARTVVLGELDTTYTKSQVIRGPRTRKSPAEKRDTMTVFGEMWGRAQGAIFGRLRGGHVSDGDTEVPRSKPMREADTRSVTTIESFVDNQEPARPAGWKPEDSDLGGYPDMARGHTVIRHPPSALKRSGTSGSAKLGRGYSDDSDTSSDSESDSDESSVNQSALGMAKGTKVYTHPYVVGRQPQERNGGGAGGPYGSLPPAPPAANALVPVSTGVIHVPRTPGSSRVGYRKGSTGSLSSDGSMASSNT
jgi:hypothetical protein